MYYITLYHVTILHIYIVSSLNKSNVCNAKNYLEWLKMRTFFSGATPLPLNSSLAPSRLRALLQSPNVSRPCFARPTTPHFPEDLPLFIYVGTFGHTILARNLTNFIILPCTN